jgi:hypothetical protein
MPDIVKELKIETAYAIKKYNLDNKQARYMYNKSVSSGVLPKNSTLIAFQISS